MVEFDQYEGHDQCDTVNPIEKKVHVETSHFKKKN